MDGAQQHRERLVNEDENDAHLWQAGREREVAAPGRRGARLSSVRHAAGGTPGAGPPDVLDPAFLGGSGVQILPRASSLIRLSQALSVQHTGSQPQKPFSPQQSEFGNDYPSCTVVSGAPRAMPGFQQVVTECLPQE